MREPGQARPRIRCERVHACKPGLGLMRGKAHTFWMEVAIFALARLIKVETNRAVEPLESQSTTPTNHENEILEREEREREIEDKSAYSDFKVE